MNIALFKRRLLRTSAWCLGLAVLPTTSLPAAHPLPPDVPVRGWEILSDSEAGDLQVIAAAPAYGINQIHLSEKISPRLAVLRDTPKLLALTNRMIDAAHAAGIQEVTIWEKSSYPTTYYPEKFRTGPGGTLDLDNPELWEWMKADYRKLLDLVPNADAMVLGYMSTDGMIMNQHSTKMTAAQKLATLVNTIASVVIGERHMAMYARIYPNDRADNPHVGEMVDLFMPEVRLLTKQTPYDYFLTSPNCAQIGLLNRPTVVELVPDPEFAGQGNVSDTWVEATLANWRSLSTLPHVVGYSIRTDRKLESRLIGKPGEIDLLAMKRITDDPDVTAEQVYKEFITAHYGAAAIPEVEAAFKLSFDITTCTYYTLGTVLGDHTQLDLEYAPAYYGFTTARWINPPVLYVRHGVNREFHLWRDVIDHLAPPFVKDPHYMTDFVKPNEQIAGSLGLEPLGGPNGHPSDSVAAMRRWTHPGEGMDEEFLRDIVTEKNYGVRLAQEAVKHIENARGVLKPADYDQLYNYQYTTLLTARMWRAATVAYFGFRTWSRGGEYQSQYVHDAVQNALAEIKEVAPMVRNCPVKPSPADYDWPKMADNAEALFKKIVDDGWPAEGEKGYPNPNAGMKFPFHG